MSAISSLPSGLEEDLERFRAWYRSELAKLRSEELSLPARRDLPRRYRAVSENGTVPPEGFAEWCEQNVVPQKQPGYYMVHIPHYVIQVGGRSAANQTRLVQGREALPTQCGLLTEPVRTTN